eukprot:1218192-Amphidinium_carterae.3
MVDKFGAMPVEKGCISSTKPDRRLWSETDGEGHGGPSGKGDAREEQSGNRSRELRCSGSGKRKDLPTWPSTWPWALEK